MSETTLDTPLSGEEVIQAILDRVARMLRDDCYLSPMAAYESFEADIQVSVKMLDIGRAPEVHIQAKVKSEKPVDPNDEDFALNAAEAHLAAQPPNQVRLAAGLPIPTLVEDSQGQKEIKPVRYARKTTEAPEI